jgi:hypothetical protein
MCRLLLDVLRNLHEAYAPASEPFGTRIETAFIGLCVAIGDLDGRAFNIAKIASYMHVPRTTVERRLKRLQHWGLIERRGNRYHANEKIFNSVLGERTYQRNRRAIAKAVEKLSDLDAAARADAMKKSARPHVPARTAARN